MATTVSIQSTIQTATHNFNTEDITDYSAVTYFSDSKSVLKLIGPLATLYNNTNFASPDFNYPGTLEANINIPLISGIIPLGAYQLTVTTHITKALAASTADSGTNTITMPLTLLDNFYAGQTLTWTGGNNAGTYTINSVVSDGFSSVITLVESLVDSTTTGSISFDEIVITVLDYTYCFEMPAASITMEATCETATLTFTDGTDYNITCEGETIAPDTLANRVMTLVSPINAAGQHVVADTVTSSATYTLTQLWTGGWTTTLSTPVTYTLPSGLIIETTITGTKALVVTCSSTLCCMSQCIQNATDRYLAQIQQGPAQIMAALVQYNKILGAFMEYSLGVKCGDTTLIDRAVTRMKAYLVDVACCNDCDDGSTAPVQITPIYNVVVSGNTLIVQEGDAYINIDQVTVGDTTTATFTLDTDQVEALIDAYIVANPSLITTIVDSMHLRTDLTSLETTYDVFVEFTGDSSIGSPIIQNVAFATGVNVNDFSLGDSLTCTSFPEGSYIIAIGSGTITMNQNATSTVVGDTFDVGYINYGNEVYKLKRTVSGVTWYVWKENLWTSKSLTTSEATDSSLTLVGDSASPGAIKFYGTDYLGNRGWQFIKSSLVEPTDGISCPAGVSTDTTLFTTTAGNAGMYLIMVTGQFTTTTSPTTLVIQLLKNAAIINTNAENQYNSNLAANSYTTFAITTLEQLVDTDLVKLRVTPVDQGVTLGNISASFVRIA